MIYDHLIIYVYCIAYLIFLLLCYYSLQNVRLRSLYHILISNVAGFKHILFLCILQQILKRHLLEELLSKFERALLRSPLDLDYMEFVCRQQLYLLQALSRHAEIPDEIIQALQAVFELVRQPSYFTAPHAVVDSTVGLRGRPRFAIEREELADKPSCALHCKNDGCFH